MNLFNQNKAQSYWSKTAKKYLNCDPTRHGDTERLFYDNELIQLKSDIHKINNVIDLGSGSGQLSYELLKKNPNLSITCVEKYKEFINIRKDIRNIRNIRNIKKDILEYKDMNNYDLILLFGVINSFNKESELRIYKMASNLMHKDSIFIIKHQCGINDEVVVDHYSKALNSNYTARYPHVAKEFEILSEIYNVEVNSMYPKKLNPHSSTNFYAFICKKK